MEALEMYWGMVTDWVAMNQLTAGLIAALFVQTCLYIITIMNTQALASRNRKLVEAMDETIEEVEELRKVESIAVSLGKDLKSTQDKLNKSLAETKAAKADLASGVKEAESQAREAIKGEFEAKKKLDQAIGDLESLRAKTKSVTGSIGTDMAEWTSRLDSLVD